MPEETMRLLVADDDEHVRRSIARLLGPSQCVLVGSCTELRVRAIAESFDGLVLDVFLGDGFSLDVVDELRGRGDDTPTLYVTGTEDEDHRIVNRAATQGVPLLFKCGLLESLRPIVARWPRRSRPPPDVGERARRHGCPPAEVEVVLLRAAGLRTEEIAARRGVKVETIRTLAKRAARRCGHRSVTALLADWLRAS